MFKKVKLDKTIKVVNKKTGEIRNAELYKVISIDIKDANQFYQMYANGVLALCGIKPDYCSKVFMYLCMESNNNEIVVDKRIREDIKNNCNISSSAITNALAILYNNGIIDKLCRGRYVINPKYSWSGNSFDRIELLKKSKIGIRIEITPDEEIYEQDKL